MDLAGRRRQDDAGFLWKLVVSDIDCHDLFAKIYFKVRASARKQDLFIISILPTPLQHIFFPSEYPAKVSQDRKQAITGLRFGSGKRETRQETFLVALNILIFWYFFLTEHWYD